MNNILENINDIARCNDRSRWCGPVESDGVLDLSRNTCYDINLKTQLQQELKSLPAEKIFMYPDERKLHESICEMCSVSTENVVIGLGSGELLDRIFKLIQGRDLCVVAPTFKMVEILARQYKCSMKRIMYTNFNNFDVNDIPPGRIVYVANPNGNNGHCFTRDEIVHIHKNSELLILDEAYINFGSTPYNVISDKLITLRTFSKSLCMPGARCGYAISTSTICNSLSYYRPSIVTTTLACELIPKLISHLPAHVDRMLQCRNYLNGKFNHVASSGNYVLLDKNNVKNIHSIKYKIIGEYARIALTDKYTMIKRIDGH